MQSTFAMLNFLCSQHVYCASHRKVPFISKVIFIPHHKKGKKKRGASSFGKMKLHTKKAVKIKTKQFG